jgi:hypothetical protein
MFQKEFSMKKHNALALAIAAIASSSAMAGTEPFFNPLTQSTAVATANHINEHASPWQVPAGIRQQNLTSMLEIEADMYQSVVRAEGLGNNASMWDMVAFDPRGENIFIPHETSHSAGVTRYNIASDFAEVIFSGDGQGPEGNWSNDFGAFDPATFTPYGTLLLGEEWSGEGRVMEVLNPHAPAHLVEVKEKHSFANVNQEGIRFGKVYADTVYYVDEDYSGSIYKLVAKDGNFDQGQTFVLSVNAFDADPSAPSYDSAVAASTRTGNAKWVPLTNKKGVAITEQDPFEGAAGFRGGRIAADQAGATPYGRPEDLEVGVLANGNEVLYFAATGEQAVYSVEMTRKNRAKVRVFASEHGTPKNVGFPATTGKINSPDNLAQDALGNIYIIEDAPNGGDVGGDIWFVRDADNDGVAESVDHFMSIQVAGAEATGMIFNPAVPSQFVVSVQHPYSTNADLFDTGSVLQGDALWLFDLTDVVAPTCDSKAAKGLVKSCSKNNANFIKKLNKAAK